MTLLVDRFTPTGVGKTGATSTPTVRTKVHPHRCGENKIAATGKIAGEGSPPQVWGKRTADERAFASYRFTPTGVGKTGGVKFVDGRSQVHPHRCGENNSGLH